MNRNIRLGYVLHFLNNLWFWLSIWVLYYLLFTDYKGIAVLEAVWVGVSAVLEMPMGAFADIVGKRKSLVLAFGFISGGNLILGLAQDFSHLLLSMVVFGVGLALVSGSFEALIYDSLDESERQNRYSRILSNLKSLSLLAAAIASVTGAWMYSLDPRLPFYLTSFVILIAAVLSLYLIEPPIDSEKYSWMAMRTKIRSAIGQMYKSNRVRNESLGLILIGVFVVITLEVLDDLLVIEIGFTEHSVGYLYAILAIVGAVAAQFSDRLSKALGVYKAMLLVMFVFGLSYFPMRYVGLIGGAGFILLREIILAFFENYRTEIINKNTDTAYRATTFSTFSMINNAAYAILGIGMSLMIGLFGLMNFSILFGFMLILVVSFSAVINRRYL